MNLFGKIFMGLLPSLVKAVTPKIKGLIGEAIRQWAPVAYDTSNPVDDMAVNFLADLFEVDLSDIQAKRLA